MDKWQSIPDEMEKELHHILHYWQQYSIDEEFGGFVGRIDQENQVYTTDPKGSVLNARILWSFSAAFHHTQNSVYLELASRAFHYIRDFFSDPEFGGLYWSVDYQGNKMDDH
jgi:mannobiose 2-epimerase